MAKIANKIAEKWFKEATAFIEKLPKEERSSLPTISRESPELDAWVYYFDQHLRWRPYLLEQVLVGRCEQMTLPTQWPEWFDQTYAPPTVIPRFIRPRLLPKEMRESLAEIQKRLGPNYGIRQIPDLRPIGDRRP